MFKSNYEILKSDHAKLRQSHDKLKSDFEVLQEQCQKFESSHDQLKSEYETLRDTYCMLCRNVDRLIRYQNQKFNQKCL
jgi:chromosome segregation ATPase